MVSLLEVTLGLAVFWLLLLFLSSRFDLESKGILVAPLILLVRTSKLNRVYARLGRPKSFWNKVGDGSQFIALLLFFVLPVILIINLINLSITDEISPILSPNPIKIVELDVIVLAIIALMFSLIIHEFAHGIQASAEGVDVEKTGFAFLAAFFAAFIQLSQDQLRALGQKSRLRIISFGIITNLFLALLLLPILLYSSSIISPFYGSSEGAMVVGIVPGTPASDLNIQNGDIIIEISQVQLNRISKTTQIGSGNDLIAALRVIPAGETFLLTTTEDEFSVSGIVPPDGSVLIAGSYLGLQVYDYREAKFSFMSKMLPYYFEVELRWLININLILGLFNLLPLPHSDGSKILDELIKPVDVKYRKQVRKIIVLFSSILLTLNIVFTVFSF